MTLKMEQASLSSPQHDEFSLKDWDLSGKISRDNTRSRRHSASNIRSYREETKSFRSTTAISSTVSSPGYTLRDTDEVIPPTYSFTTALRALQSRSGYGWQWLSPDAVALNSKWNEAEKYICNPLSGEFPIECLSAKTLSGRSFAALKTKTTISGPLIYPSRLSVSTAVQEDKVQSTFQEKRENLTRDVGTQSTPLDDSSSSSSHASTHSTETPYELPKAFQDSKFEVEVEITEAEELKKQGQGKGQVMKKCRSVSCLPWRKSRGDNKKVHGSFCFGGKV